MGKSKKFAKYHFKRIPPFRRVNFEAEFGNGVKVFAINNFNLKENSYEKVMLKEVKDQYMTGENLLFAAMLREE